MKQHLYSLIFVIAFVLGWFTNHSVQTFTETVSKELIVNTLSSDDEVSIVVPSIEYVLPEVVIIGRSIIPENKYFYNAEINCEDVVKADNAIVRNPLNLYALLNRKIMLFVDSNAVRINIDNILPTLPEVVKDNFSPYGIDDPCIMNARAPGNNKDPNDIINTKGAV